MKKTTKNNLIAFSCALAMVAVGGAVAMQQAKVNAAENTTQGTMSLAGAELRLAKQDDQTGNGLRFVVQANATALPQGTTATGTLVIPTELLGGAELTTATENAENFVTTTAWNIFDGNAQTYAYYWNMPESFYNVELTYRGYIVINGTTYYTEDAETSMAEVALAVYNNAEASTYEKTAAEAFLLDYTVTFSDGTATYGTETARYGSTLTQTPATPTAPNGKLFDGWQDAAGNAIDLETYVVKGNATIAPTYKDKEAVALANAKDVETKVDNTIAFTGLIDGEVTGVSIGNVALTGWTYDDATDTLTLPATSLTTVEKGQNKTLTMETATKMYSQKVWVVNKVIKDFQTLRTLYSTSYVDIDSTTHAISGYYVLGADITCEKRSWNSSGSLGTGLALHYFISDANFNFFTGAPQATLDEWTTEGNWDGFVGTFDGRGYAIINMPAVQGGMFNRIGENGVVKNLILKNVNLRTGGYLADVAALAQENHGTIENVMVSVAAMARQANSSALVMKNYGTIKNIYVRAYKSGDWADHFYAVCNNQDNGTVTNVVVSTTFTLLDGTLTGLTTTTGDGWSTVNKQWYPRFGTAADGFCSEDGVNGRDGVFVIYSDTVVEIDAYNASKVDAIS